MSPSRLLAFVRSHNGQRNAELSHDGKHVTLYVNGQAQRVRATMSDVRQALGY